MVGHDEEGVRYPCRILDFVTKSTQLQALLRDARFLSIGQVLDDGHVPGDPFGEHFSEVTAEGLVKRVDSVEGLACLPWHKDCERGGHAMFCSGLTVGHVPHSDRRSPWGIGCHRRVTPRSHRLAPWLMPDSTSPRLPCRPIVGT